MQNAEHFLKTKILIIQNVFESQQYGVVEGSKINVERNRKMNPKRVLTPQELMPSRPLTFVGKTGRIVAVGTIMGLTMLASVNSAQAGVVNDDQNSTFISTDPGQQNNSDDMTGICIVAQTICGVGSIE